METVPAEITLPPAAWRHYRHFAWVIHEQRLLVLVLGLLLAACGLVWSLAWRLQHKPAVVVRAAPSLKEAAADFYGIPEISYDQMAFFLHGCLPLLYATDDGGHRLLPLAQGLVAPEIYTAAERRLNQAGPAVLANRITQSLTITGVSDVVADARSRRAAAYVRGYVTGHGAARRGGILSLAGAGPLGGQSHEPAEPVAFLPPAFCGPGRRGRAGLGQVPR